MRQCLHAMHMDDRIKVRHAGARLTAHVLGANAANRLHRALLPVPHSPCSVCRVGLLCVCCSEATRMTSRPTLVSALLGVAVPAPIAAVLLAIFVSALARAAPSSWAPYHPLRRRPTRPPRPPRPEAGAPEAEPLVAMSEPSVTDPPKSAAPKTGPRPRPSAVRDRARRPASHARDPARRPTPASERRAMPARGTVSARGTVDDGVRCGCARVPVPSWRRPPRVF